MSLNISSASMPRACKPLNLTLTDNASVGLPIPLPSPAAPVH